MLKKRINWKKLENRLEMLENGMLDDSLKSATPTFILEP